MDKNLRLHGLLQAYSRANRSLNSVKTFGNIVCFRNLEKATNESIALFGDKEAGGVVLLKSYDEYYNDDLVFEMELINQFIASLDMGANIDENWQKFVNKRKIEELDVAYILFKTCLSNFSKAWPPAGPPEASFIILINFVPKEVGTF